MEFRLDAEQELVEKTARSLAQSHAAKLPRLAVNDVINPEPSTERLETIEACWSELVTLGFTALLIPSDAGGAGGTLLDGVLVAEALAYHLVPVPYAGSAII